MSDYPFQRLIVYNVVPGTSWITWDIHPNFKDSLPYSFQLQCNRVNNPDDSGWENIGAPVINAIQLEDSESESYGYSLDKYYRVVLTSQRGTYVSLPEGCFGQLTRKEWKLAREIIRKENLRHSIVSTRGILLKRLKYGERCPYCTDEGTEGTTNSKCTHCYGTGYLGGYHTPLKLQMMEITPSQLKEIHHSDNVTTFNMSFDRYQARSAGVPELNNGDIWVDLTTSQRFSITGSQVIAQIRRVPLVRKVDMNLLPVTDIAYNIPIGETNYTGSKIVESNGCGIKLVDHDYPSTDSLRYVNSDGDPIAGASIQIISGTTLIGETTTDVNGRWNENFLLDAGDYSIVFERPGLYGPDTVSITITSEEYTAEEAKENVARNTVIETDYLSTFL